MAADELEYDEEGGGKGTELATGAGIGAIDDDELDGTTILGLAGRGSNFGLLGG